MTVLPPFAYAPEVDMLLQVFPHDHRLPALARLMTGAPAELAAALLAEFGPGDWRISGWTSEVVQYRVEMRAIVRLSVRADEFTSGAVQSRQFFAKLYRDEIQARQSFHMQDALHRRVTELQSPLTVAKPLDGGRRLRAVVTTAVPGVSLLKIIRRGDSIAPAVQAAARAVASLHTLDVGAPVRSFADDITRLKDARDAIGKARPALARAVSDTVDAVIAGLAGAPAALIHGDLKPEHILIEGNQVALIDFDLVATADPIIDVAHILAYLGRSEERARARSHQPGDVAQAFIDEYFAHVPDEWRRRLPFYHAMTSIHKAVGLSRKSASSPAGQLEAVLREGQAFLELDGGQAAAPTFKRRITRRATAAETLSTES